MTTLKQIAEEAGVSVKTVSNILNGITRGCRPKVAERARRVMEIAERLNYQPNSTARHLRRGRQGKIAIVAAPWLGFFPAGLLQGLTAALRSEQISLVFHYLENKVRSRELWKEAGCDGLLCNGSALAYLEDDPDEALRNVPAVLVNYPARVNAVGIADRQGAETLVLSAATGDGRPVAFVSTTPEHWSRADLFCVQERRRGYRDAMKILDQEPRELMPSRLLRDEELQEFVRNAVASLPKPVALFVHEPWEVSFVCQAVLELGLRMPEDLVPMVLDTYEMTERPHGLPMVVSRVDWKQVGRLSFKMLQRRMEDPSKDLPSILVSFRKPLFQWCGELRRAG